MLGRGKIQGEEGSKNGFHQGIGGKEKNVFFNIQAQCAIPKWIQYFHIFCIDLIKFDQVKCKMNFSNEEMYWRFCREKV